MDKQEYHHPNWFSLYTLVAGIFGLLLLEVRANFSVTAHRILEVAIVLALFYLINLWLRMNELAILMEARDGFRKALVDSRTSLPETQPGISAQDSSNDRQKHTNPSNALLARVFSFLGLTGVFLHGRDL